MNFTLIQKSYPSILSKCKINFNTCRNVHTIVCRTALIKPAFCTRSNWQCNRKNLLHVTKLQFGNVNPNVELPVSSVNYSALQLKKRPKKRQKPISTEDHIGEWNILALATAEEYDLEGLVQALLEQNLYVPDTISSTTSCKI